MQSWGWKKWMKWIAGLIAAVAAAVAGYVASGCAQSVPVVVQQQTLHCDAVIENSDGLTFSGCQLNGSQESEQGDSDADADAEGEVPIKLKLPETSCYTPPGWRRPPPRWALN
jgi:hypothetical protein